MSYLRLPVTVRYRKTQRSKKSFVKVIRGRTADSIEKLSELKIHGINEKTVIEHVGVGYRYIPKEKLSVSDKRAIQTIRDSSHIK